MESRSHTNILRLCFGVHGVTWSNPALESPETKPYARTISAGLDGICFDAKINNFRVACKSDLCVYPFEVW